MLSVNVQELNVLKQIGSAVENILCCQDGVVREVPPVRVHGTALMEAPVPVPVRKMTVKPATKKPVPPSESKRRAEVEKRRNKVCKACKNPFHDTSLRNVANTCDACKSKRDAPAVPTKASAIRDSARRVAEMDPLEVAERAAEAQRRLDDMG